MKCDDLPVVSVHPSTTAMSGSILTAASHDEISDDPSLTVEL